jgi:hypothetical protein
VDDELATQPDDLPNLLDGRWLARRTRRAIAPWCPPSGA